MCHRRTDWSRTSSRASESDEESESESDRAWWGARVAREATRRARAVKPRASAKERLAAFVSPDEIVTTEETPTDGTPTDEPPTEPMVEPEPETSAEPSESETADETEEDEREAEPIPADD